MKKVFLCAYFLFLLVSGYSQFDSIANIYAQSINATDLREHLSIVASDSMEGRETGYIGLTKASNYIQSVLSSFNIPTEKSDYMVTIDEPHNQQIVIEGKEYNFLEDFFTLTKFNQGDISTEEILFLGYGISSKYYDDYKDVDVKGKVLLVLDGEPVRSNGKYLVSKKDQPSEWSKGWMTKIDQARNAGAKALLIIKDDYKNKEAKVARIVGRKEVRITEESDYETKGFPAFFLSDKLEEELLKSSLISSNIKKEIGKTKRPVNATIKKSVLFKTSRITPGIIVSNILGKIEGTDKKEEYVVISAHYDHIGVKDGEIYNGADDDGSGTVSMLEIAEAFSRAKAQGNGPRRTILFLAFSGEEWGLLGSHSYAEKPLYPLENTVVDLNIDMIGRVDEKHGEDSNYVYLIGSDKISSELHTLSENTNEVYAKLSLDYTYNHPDDPNQFYYRSDHYNFAKNGIPVIFYFSGVHEDYHQPTDTVDKIMFGKMTTIVRLIFHTAWDIANRDNKLLVDKKNDFEER